VDGKKVKTDDFEYKDCYKSRCDGDEEDMGPGCYCKGGLFWNPNTTSCVKRECELPKIPINLKAKGCYSLADEATQFTWEVDSVRKYTYSIFDSSNNIVNSESFMGETNENKGFTVSGKIGTLEIPKTALVPGNYRIEVEDQALKTKSSEEKNFLVKTGT
jgi:hypothetical protein